MDLHVFRDEILQKGHALYRDMPWRITKNPYHILLSEIMLQQTQVDRVVPYYEKFVKKYPKIQDLAAASFSDVLSLWSGLGYNRRAKWLRECAQKIVSEFDGKVPNTIEELTTLPGVGHNTAAAVCVYAFNMSENFIETNIRTVFIFHLFKNSVETVRDKEILLLQNEILDSGVDPKKWYLSLMDYGTYLKKEEGNSAQKSRSYRKQSTFEGSVRQVRGALLKLFIQGPPIGLEAIEDSLKKYDNATSKKALSQLLDEGFIVKDDTGLYYLKK